MGNESIAAGEVVYLLKELPGDRRIHEIGTRAHVLADRGSVIVLHLDGADAEVVSCPREHVAAARVRHPRERTHRVSPASLGHAAA